MTIRSFLFVPGDRPDRMRKALGSGADALILDLEDSVTATNKAAARDHVGAFLRETERTVKLLVRVNALSSGLTLLDLESVLDGQPDGLMLPKSEGAESIRKLDSLLGGSTIRILPVVTETASAVFQTGSYEAVSDRLCGMTWGAEDLSAALGASRARETDGRYRAPYELARSLTLLGARAAGAEAVETVYPNFADLEGLRAYAERGREDGFTGMLAIHPNQVSIIHHAFRPSEAELHRARRIVELFAARSGAGALSLDGEMVDAPHLAEAGRVLARFQDSIDGE